MTKITLDQVYYSPTVEKASRLQVNMAARLLQYKYYVYKKRVFKTSQWDNVIYLTFVSFKEVLDSYKTDFLNVENL